MTYSKRDRATALRVLDSALLHALRGDSFPRLTALRFTRVKRGGAADKMSDKAACKAAEILGERTDRTLRLARCLLAEGWSPP